MQYIWRIWPTSTVVLAVECQCQTSYTQVQMVMWPMGVVFFNTSTSHAKCFTYTVHWVLPKNVSARDSLQEWLWWKFLTYLNKENAVIFTCLAFSSLIPDSIFHHPPLYLPRHCRCPVSCSWPEQTCISSITFDFEGNFASLRENFMLISCSTPPEMNNCPVSLTPQLGLFLIVLPSQTSLFSLLSSKGNMKPAKCSSYE